MLHDRCKCCSKNAPPPSSYPHQCSRLAIKTCTTNTPYIPWQHRLPSLNSPALTTEIVLLIKFMREQARAKFATREPTYAILPGLLLSIQWLKISLFSKHPSPPQISTPTLHTTTPALFLYQPPPLCHRNTGTSKNRRQAVRASSHPTGGGGGRRGWGVLGAGGRMSTKTK